MATARPVIPIKRSQTDKSTTPPLIWKGKDHPRHLPGQVLVRASSYQGPEWVRRYRRWSLRIEYALLHEPGVVSQFFNFGSNPDEPAIKWSGKYFSAWCIANGEPPRRGEELCPSVFIGQMFLVEIADCVNDSDGKAKNGALVYSKVEKLIERVIP